jgi:Rps23 Pro-64 3,4-dihydroxylase Tpa1-like proline 4-hydroxylase
MLDHDRLLNLAKQLKEEYKSNEPFRHIVIDDFLPLDVAEKCRDQFPKKKEMDQDTFQKQEIKIASRPDVKGFPDYLKSVLYALNSHEMTFFLEELTGINGILGDPSYFGAGIHQTFQGGKLGIHVDFNFHEKYQLERRLNVILFLNNEWEESYGGHLELWDKEMKNCIKRVLPKFNRAVIFNTSDDSYHGHPDPLTCPKGESRKSIALYYYTVDRTDGAGRVQWTEHKQRPDGFVDYKFQNQPVPVSKRIKKVIKEFIPPIIVKAYQKLK